MNCWRMIWHCQTPQGTLQIAPMLAIVMPSRGDYPPLAGRAECTDAFRDALVRIWQEWRWREKMLPLFTFGCGLKSAAISRNCGGLNRHWAKRNHSAVADVAKPLELPAGLGSVQLTAEAIFALRVQTKRSACVSKRQDCCILSGATADVS